MSDQYGDRGSGIDAQGIKPPAAFSIDELNPADGVVVLVLAGELDLATADRFRDAIDRMLETDAPTGVVLDLEEAAFMDSSMLKELLRAHAELSARGATLVLAQVGHAVQRLLDLTRTSELLACEPSRDAALARLSAG